MNTRTGPIGAKLRFATHDTSPRCSYLILIMMISLVAVASPASAACVEVTVQDPDGLRVEGASVAAGAQELVTGGSGQVALCDAAVESITVRAMGFKDQQHPLPKEGGLTIRLELPARVETPVIVTGTTEPRELAEINRTVVVMPVSEPKIPAWSFPDVLKQDPSLDVRERGPDGTQADLSIRGSTFGQVLVLVNGVRLNDSQSGHHNMDLPLPFESVQQVEVLHGSGATLYGSDAIGGTVNFVTKKPEAAELKLMGGLGDFGWHRQGATAGFQRGIWSQQVSFARDFSSGFDPGRDFQNKSLMSESFFDTEKGSTSILFGYNDRPFGANGFYGPWDSWEKTGTRFLAASQSLGRNPDKLQHRFNFSFRRHNDHFILYRHQPEIFQNLHQADTYQGNYALSGRINDKVTWSAGGSMLSEHIDSTNLGLRERNRAAAFLMFDLRPTGKLSLTVGVREEVWRKWKGETSPTLSIGYWLGGGFKLRGQLGHAYRVPTFTDLFYEDPVNKGNENLVPESAWNYEAGLDWYSKGNTRFTATWFQRREDNSIDWVRESEGGKFNARNIQELTFNGGEFSLRHRIGQREIGVDYTLIRASRVPQPDVVSLYVFNFPLNSVSAVYNGPLGKEIYLKMRLGAFNRTWQSTKALWDVSLMRTWGRFTPFFQATNLLNTHHEAFQGLAQPGRWLRGGLKLQVF